jgi:hypothetical protein
MTDDRFNIENFANGIVEQAHEDYIEALLLENKAIRILNKAARLKQSVLKFYGTEWYYSLTQVDPATLIDTARKQADYIIWQRNHKCETCLNETCPHKVERANWKMWADGRRVCLNEAGRKKDD